MKLLSLLSHTVWQCQVSELGLLIETADMLYIEATLSACPVVPA